MLLDHQHAEILQAAVPGRGQGEAIANALTVLVRTGNHVQEETEIGSAPGHRTGHGQINVARQGLRSRRGVPAYWHQAKGRLVRVDATKMRGPPQRTADIGAERERTEPGGECGRRSTRRAAGRASNIPWVVGGAVNLVVA